MKRIFKTVGFVALVALNCFTVSFNSSTANEPVLTNTVQAAAENNGQTVSANSFYHDVPTEHTVSIRTLAAPSCFKSRFTDGDVLNTALLHLSNPVFCQYSFFSRHHIPRLRNSDIIFPFHYFW